MNMESKWLKLERPPIVEAVIGVKFKDNYLSLDEINKIYNDSFKTEYPIKNDNIGVGIGYDFKEDKVSRNKESLGIRISSDENRKATLFVERNRLTLSNLAPYISGDKLIESYKIAWESYSKRIKNPEIVDIGLRYINKFKIDQKDLSGFKIFPVFANSIHTKMLVSRFMGQYSINNEHYGAEAFVTVIMEPVPNEETISVIFDIDTHNKMKLDYNDFDSSIGDVVKRLRDFKNDIFFSNVEPDKIIIGDL